MSEQPEREMEMAAENGRILRRMAMIVLVIVLLINIPISSWGASLLQMLPQENAQVILREGVVLQDSQGAYYLMHNHQLRPFYGPEAYNWYIRVSGHKPQSAADRIINGYQRGAPVYRLVRCGGDEIVYAWYDGKKRPFAPAADYVPYSNARWDQVSWMSCEQLDKMSTGQPVTD
jgi:hypothetical protein